MSQATIKQIQKLINSLETPADCVTVSKILKARYKTIQSLASMAFYKGQAVEFKSNKTGEIISGIIEKVNTKTVDIRTARFGYRVSPSMLRPLSKAPAMQL